MQTSQPTALKGSVSSEYSQPITRNLNRSRAVRLPSKLTQPRDLSVSLLPWYRFVARFHFGTEVKKSRSRYVPVRRNFAVFCVLSVSEINKLRVFNTAKYSDSPRLHGFKAFVINRFQTFSACASGMRP